MELTEIRKKVKKKLEKERYEHTKGVMYTAASLAMANGSDIKQAMFAGLLHDCAKCIPNEEKLTLCKKYDIPVSKFELDSPYLLHAKLGAFLAQKEYDITDAEILHAIEVHTTGAPDMSLLDKIIFVADYIEPNREKAPHLTAIRQLAFSNLDACVAQILKDTLDYLKKRGGSIDPQTQETFEFYRKYLEES